VASTSSRALNDRVFILSISEMYLFMEPDMAILL